MQNNESASERWQALQPADPLSSGSSRPGGRLRAGMPAPLVQTQLCAWSLHRNVERLRQSRRALGHVQGDVAAGNGGGNGHVELVEPDESWGQSLIQYGARQFLISEEKLDWSRKLGLTGCELAGDGRA